MNRRRSKRAEILVLLTACGAASTEAPTTVPPVMKSEPAKVEAGADDAASPEPIAPMTPNVAGYRFGIRSDEAIATCSKAGHRTTTQPPPLPNTTSFTCDGPIDPFAPLKTTGSQLIICAEKGLCGVTSALALQDPDTKKTTPSSVVFANTVKLLAAKYGPPKHPDHIPTEVDVSTMCSNARPEARTSVALALWQWQGGGFIIVSLQCEGGAAFVSVSYANADAASNFLTLIKAREETY